jgi:hypothetical protein
MGTKVADPTEKRDKTMNITIEIKKISHAPGTIGWLAENATQIKIGSTKDNERGAWLKDKDGKTITILALDSREAGSLCRVTREMHEWTLSADMRFTDAAWQMIQQFSALAVEQMQEPAEMADAYQVSLIATQEAAK